MGLFSSSWWSHCKTPSTWSKFARSPGHQHANILSTFAVDPSNIQYQYIAIFCQFFGSSLKITHPKQRFYVKLRVYVGLRYMYAHIYIHIWHIHVRYGRLHPSTEIPSQRFHIYVYSSPYIYHPRCRFRWRFRFWPQTWDWSSPRLSFWRITAFWAYVVLFSLWECAEK